jgi:deoxyxylulose-5-phosphate synthase
MYANVLVTGALERIVATRTPSVLAPYPKAKESSLDALPSHTTYRIVSAHVPLSSSGQVAAAGSAQSKRWSYA